MTPATVKVTDAGQMSLPAELRRRWQVERVLVIDHGDHAEIRPLPDDIFARLRGKYAGLEGTTSEQMRAESRAEELAAEERRGRA
ncbi:MAG: AbrB/MazE/SpoVT family DNA-binding domain-containing protein [Ilumatobacteraceae bacterium]